MFEEIASGLGLDTQRALLDHQPSQRHKFNVTHRPAGAAMRYDAHKGMK
jgi:hypothetical protein